MPEINIGTIPTEIGNMQQLKRLNMNSNNLTGSWQHIAVSQLFCETGRRHLIFQQIITVENLLYIRISTSVEQPLMNIHVLLNKLFSLWCHMFMLNFYCHSWNRIIKINMISFFLSFLSLLYYWNTDTCRQNSKWNCPAEDKYPATETQSTFWFVITAIQLFTVCLYTWFDEWVYESHFFGKCQRE